MATVTPFPHPDTTWARTVHTVAAKARAAFPSLGGKIEHSTALVLAGGVVATDHPQRYLVASASDPAGVTSYDVTCGKPSTCTCEDFTHRQAHEPDFRCKHLLAVWIYRRALAPPAPAGEAQVWLANMPPAPCPEAAFSITLKGSMGGHEVLLTARGQTWEAFRANIARLSGLLDAPALSPPPASQASAPAAAAPPTPEGWCLVHQCQMERQSNERGSWYSHRTAEGWCRGKARKGA